MCGRYTLISELQQLAEEFGLTDIRAFAPRYNIAPTQPAPVVRVAAGGDARSLEPLQWGLVPSWAKDPKAVQNPINAKSETAAKQPFFRAAFKRRRCLVPTSGFYEWQKRGEGQPKQPFFIRRRDERPFAFAGLWEHWHGADGSELETFTILTTSPNELMSPIHNRMPVILHRDDYDCWLDPDEQDADRLNALLTPFPADRLEAVAVSTRVNNPRHDAPDCIAPVADDAPLDHPPDTLF